MKTIGFIGLGLIGGSIAKTIRKFHPDYHILAYAKHKETLAAALNCNAIDAVLEEKDERYHTCDYIFLCAPVEYNIEYLKYLKNVISDDCIITDAGSVKGPIHKAVEELGMDHCFIGGHPMAGTQYSGFGHARANLYHNAPMVIVPPDFDNMELLARAQELLRPAGFGSYSVTTAEKHDEMIAFTSQMAHLVSNAYIKSPAEAHKGFSAGSYKDMTRVAWLNAPMWSELFLEHRDNMLHELDCLMDRLMEYRAAIAEDDAAALTQLLEDGKKRKEEVDGH